MKIVNILVQHNIPLAFADHSNFFNARDYSSARIKTTCIVSDSLVHYFKSVLVVFQ